MTSGPRRWEAAFKVFLILAICCGLAGISVVGLSAVDNDSVGPLSEAARAVGFVAIMAFPFVCLGVLVFGLPALILARRFGWNQSVYQAFFVGCTVGGIAGFATLGLAFPYIALSLGAGLGSLSGGISGLLWWNWFESIESETI